MLLQKFVLKRPFGHDLVSIYQPIINFHSGSMFFSTYLNIISDNIQLSYFENACPKPRF